VAINQQMIKSKRSVQDTDEGPEVKYKTVVKYFDAVAKMWKPLPSVAQLGNETQTCFCAEYFGNHLFVAGKNQSGQFVIYRYNVGNNSWDTQQPILEPNHQIKCLRSVDDYLYAISESNPPQRYSLAKLPRALSIQRRSFINSDGYHRLSNVATVVVRNKIHVVHGCEKEESLLWENKPAVVHCFDPVKNKWEQKSSACHPHFGSCLFMVNNRMCLAGEKVSCDNSGKPRGHPAPVEVYREETNTWSVLKQKHIPPNKLGAVEIEGKVYFVINKFPIDSGIRIPPEEMYHIHLDEWENLAKVSNKAVLCYLPVKKESLVTEHDESQADSVTTEVSA